MKIIGVIKKIASYLFMLGIVTLILTVVQPMNPEVDKIFRIGAGIVMAVCLVLLFALPQPPEEDKSGDSTQPES